MLGVVLCKMNGNPSSLKQETLEVQVQPGSPSKSWGEAGKRREERCVLAHNAAVRWLYLRVVHHKLQITRRDFKHSTKRWWMFEVLGLLIPPSFPNVFLPWNITLYLINIHNYRESIILKMASITVTGTGCQPWALSSMLPNENWWKSKFKYKWGQDIQTGMIIECLLTNKEINLNPFDQSFWVSNWSLSLLGWRKDPQRWRQISL